jgi:hypothetical protein
VYGRLLDNVCVCVCLHNTNITQIDSWLIYIHTRTYIHTCIHTYRGHEVVAKLKKEGRKSAWKLVDTLRMISSRLGNMEVYMDRSENDALGQVRSACEALLKV